MKFKLAFSTATALGLLMGGAMADGNQSYTKQDGADNILVIQQYRSSNNRVGTELNPILQKGDDNQFRETQSTGTSVGNGNVIDAGKQLGNNNRFSSSYSNGAGGNLIGDLLQRGNSNTATVIRDGQRNGVVNTIVQGAEAAAPEGEGGNQNRLRINQAGSAASTGGNVIQTAKQIGSGNGGANINPQNRQDWGTWIDQRGSQNLITEASIYGSNNVAPHPNTGNNAGGKAVLDIYQQGTANEARAIINGSVGNQIVIEQAGLTGTGSLGTGNKADIESGLNSASTGNTARAFQHGDGNQVFARQNGDANTIRSNQTGTYNNLNVIQTQDGNTALVNISGDFNGNGLLAGTSSTQTPLGLANANGLSSGDIVQTGFSNTAELTISGSSSNQFAFLQQGNSNTILGEVSGGGSNSATHVQIGSNNTSHFQQIGATNQMSVNQ